MQSSRSDIYVPGVDKGISRWQQATGESKEISYKTITKILKKKDFKTAKILLQQVINDKDAAPLVKEKANYLMGLLLLNGRSKIEGDVAQGLEYLKNGPPAAKYTLGVIYLKGLYGVPSDGKMGIDYLEEASHQGHKKASLTLAYLYELAQTSGGIENKKINQSAITRFFLDGPDLLKKYDDRTIRKRINLAKKSDQPELYLKYGDLAWSQWTKEKKVFTNKIMERAWEDAQKISGKKIPKEAQAHVKAAQRKLGMMHYDKGVGRKSPWYHEKAVEYWERAAAQPDPDSAALYYLGLAYSSGKGVKKDVEKGKGFLKEAAKLGFKQSNVMLAHLDKTKPLSKKDLKDKNDLNLSRAPEIDVIKAGKPILSKACTWFKKHAGAIIGGILIASITTVAVAAIAAGLIALTIFFPHVMIPIWVVAGVFALSALGIGALFFAALAGGAGH